MTSFHTTKMNLTSMRFKKKTGTGQKKTTLRRHLRGAHYKRGFALREFLVGVDEIGFYRPFPYLSIG
jgi:hypothetical protein